MRSTFGFCDLLLVLFQEFCDKVFGKAFQVRSRKIAATISFVHFFYLLCVRMVETFKVFCSSCGMKQFENLKETLVTI